LGVGRQSDGWAAAAADPGRSGFGGSVPGGAAAPAFPRGGLPQGGDPAHAAAARRLRPWLLLHLELHGGPSAASRRPARGVTAFSMAPAAPARRPGNRTVGAAGKGLGGGEGDGARAGRILGTCTILAPSKP